MDKAYEKIMKYVELIGMLPDYYKKDPIMQKAIYDSVERNDEHFLTNFKNYFKNKDNIKEIKKDEENKEVNVLVWDTYKEYGPIKQHELFVRKLYPNNEICHICKQNKEIYLIFAPESKFCSTLFICCNECTVKMRAIPVMYYCLKLTDMGGNWLLNNHKYKFKDTKNTYIWMNKPEKLEPPVNIFDNCY